MPRGGKREGAGAKRKPYHLKKVPISLKLPRWLIKWLNEQDDSRAVIIETALIEFNGLEDKSDEGVY